MKDIREKRTFRAVSDDGREHVLIECRAIVNAETMWDHLPDEEEGTPYFCTRDAKPVNLVSEGVYELPSGVIVREAIATQS